MLDILTSILPIIAAVIVASAGYVKNTASTSAEGFDLVKFGATLIVGAGVAVVMLGTGSPISTESIEVQVVAYSGLIVLVENGIKIVTRGAVRIPSTWVNAFLPEATATPAAAPVAAEPVKTVPSVNVAAAGVSDKSVPASNTVVKTADPDDKIASIAVKSYPAILTGVSPFDAKYLIVCDPAEGVHAAVKAVVDHGDGSAVEEVPIKNGVVQISHRYQYAQALTMVDNAPSQYYSEVFYPQIVVLSADGLKGHMNLLGQKDTKNGASLIITVKDAAAVLAGKV